MMSLTFDNIKQYKKSNNTWFFRFKKLGNKYLITNDIWRYYYLSQKQFADYISWKITKWNVYSDLLEKGFIQGDGYGRRLASEYQRQNIHLFNGPTLHIIVTTLRCNHVCRYCHASVAPLEKWEYDMTIETAEKVVDTIFYSSSNSITIELQWWESLANWDVVKFIIEYAQSKAKPLEKKVDYTIVTNLTMMDKEKLDYLLDKNVHICTSLDGDKESHNYNRTYADGDSFDTVTLWMKKISKAHKRRWGGDYSVWAIMTMTRKTLERYREAIDTYVKIWQKWIFLRPLNPYGFAEKNLEKIWFTMEEFVEVYRKSMDYIIEINKKWTFFMESLSEVYLKKIIANDPMNYMDERNPCGAWIGQVAYDYNWKIYSCDEWRMLWRTWDDTFQISEVKWSWEETYRSMIDSEMTKAIVQSSTLDGLPGFNDDVYKPYMWVCPIYNYQTTWNIFPNYSKSDRKLLSVGILDYLFEKLQDPEIEKIFRSWVIKTPPTNQVIKNNSKKKGGENSSWLSKK